MNSNTAGPGAGKRRSRSASLLLKQLGVRLRKDPLGTLRRGAYHLFVGRFKYARGAGYDAPRFWQDRFERCGLSFDSVTDEGFTDEENEKRYRETKEKFLLFCESQNIDFGSCKTLEIGCGTGFYTQTLRESGVKDYTGIDITDALFSSLRENHPGYRFIKQDVTSERIEGSYDLVVMIDVVQHIVSEDKLRQAMKNLEACLAQNGVFIIAPLCPTSRKAPLVYFLRMWSLDNVTRHFDGCTISEPGPFRGNDTIVAIRK